MSHPFITQSDTPRNRRPVQYQYHMAHGGAWCMHGAWTGARGAGETGRTDHRHAGPREPRDQEFDTTHSRVLVTRDACRLTSCCMMTVVPLRCLEMSVSVLRCALLSPTASHMLRAHRVQRRAGGLWHRAEPGVLSSPAVQLALDIRAKEARVLPALSAHHPSLLRQ